MRKAFFTTLLLALTSVFAQAQNTQPDMADKLRGEGKIYVVVLVLATIFAGIIGFLVRLDRKITKLEKNNS
jgi:hypothetical protein